MIALFEKKFEEIKDRFNTGELIAVFAKFEVEKLMEEVDYSLDILKEVSEKDSMKRRFLALKKQLAEFEEFVVGFLSQNTL